MKCLLLVPASEKRQHQTGIYNNVNNKIFSLETKLDSTLYNVVYSLCLVKEDLFRFVFEAAFLDYHDFLDGTVWH